MTFTRWIIATATFAACWCVGAFALLPRMEAKLLRAANEALTAQQTLTGRLDRVQILFEGQTAKLTGKVRTAQDQLVVGAVRRHSPVGHEHDVIGQGDRRGT